jgi:hypothetical protein
VTGWLLPSWLAGWLHEPFVENHEQLPARMVNYTGVFDGQTTFWGEIDRQHILPSGEELG